MILVDHLLIGTAVGLSLSSNDPSIITTTVLASLMPDIDSIFFRPGKISYLTYHRTVTHSMFFAPLYAIIIALICKLIFYETTLGILVYSAFWGIVSHLIVDIFNGFGTMVFYPISKKKIHLDLIYEFDPIFSLMFLGITIEFYFLGENITSSIISLNLFLIVMYYFSRLASKRKFLRNIKIQFPDIFQDSFKLNLVPAKYWRWKGIVKKNNVHYVFRKIKKVIEVEKRKINDIPKSLMNPNIREYVDYARNLDVEIAPKELILKNLIYSPSVYTLKMKTEGPEKNNINISIPNIKYDDY